MSTAAIPGAPLPVRTPGSRARGRHRRPERPEVPVGAPTLVLAVPAEATPETVAVVDELVSVIRGEQPGIEVVAGWLRSAASTEAATDAADRAEGEAGEPVEYSPVTDRPRPTVEELLVAAAEAGLPAPVLVPLLPGPHAYVGHLQQLAAQAGAVVTDPLGPHPLLAEAVHVRLSEAGLARADRARLFAIATAADGVVLTTAGGEDAAAAAGITGVLLAARLAVPVVAAALDVPGSVAAAVEHLRATGAQRPALAPLVIGPEVSAELLLAATEETGCPSAAPVGAYPTVGQLAASTYLAVLPALLPPPLEEEPEQAVEQAEAAEQA
ncbi:sirohydrochlorin chelatase [Kitasatospora sp. NPDC058965]|uniref:sirohydrochlorin chelatase n=1 Tax=Kitasatospora sp. NPDC058965 TaxID=3346682 RepID=UPI0036913054